jgi:hypothetical protein
MNIREMKGSTFKKLMNGQSSAMRFHNKNKNGGNFCLGIYGINGKDYELWGYYNKEGVIHFLTFGYLYKNGVQIIDSAAHDINKIIDSMKLIIKIRNEEI